MQIHEHRDAALAQLQAASEHLSDAYMRQAQASERVLEAARESNVLGLGVPIGVM